MRHMIEYGDYMPHGMCLLWQSWLLALGAGADLLIFLAYMAIPIALLTVLRRRGDVPHPTLVLLFASFILLCGLTHLAGIVTLWWPIYPWIGALKLLTGIVSAITAIVLFRLIPTLVALPSPAKLQEASKKLWEEMSAHESTLASLEEQVAQRTEELRRVNDTLRSADPRSRPPQRQSAFGRQLGRQPERQVFGHQGGVYRNAARPHPGAGQGDRADQAGG